MTQERGPRTARAPFKVGLLWPDSYASGMASLGFQWVCASLNREGVVSCERFFFTSDRAGRGREPRSLERSTPLRACDLLAVSISYEPDLLNLAAMLLAAGIEPLASRRGEDSPLIVAGGPLTRSNPDPLLAMADVVVCGDGEDGLQGLVEAIGRGARSREELCGALLARQGAISASSPSPPPCHPERTSPPYMLAVTGDHECKRQSAKCKVQNGQASWLSATIPSTALRAGDHPPSHEASAGLRRPSTITNDCRSSRSCLAPEAGDALLPVSEGPPGIGCAVAGSSALPLVGAYVAPAGAFGGMTLVEVSRGCPKGCTFCLGRRDNAPLRMASADQVLAAVPPDTPGLGLIGAAISFHPELKRMLEWAARNGKRAGVSSLRADRLDRETVDLLKACGSEVLTVAADAASERLRAAVLKDVTEEDVIRAASMARQAGLHALKLYMMIGLPGEDDEDVAELAGLLNRLNAMVPVVLSLAVFVPKKRTPLAQAAFGPADEAARRIALLKKRCSGGIRFGNVSPRQAALECLLSHATVEDGALIAQAARDGADLAAMRKAFGVRLDRLLRSVRLPRSSPSPAGSSARGCR